MTDYLAVLPKELRELSNYYVNYDNWYYLNSGSGTTILLVFHR